MKKRRLLQEGEFNNIKTICNAKIMKTKDIADVFERTTATVCRVRRSADYAEYKAPRRVVKKQENFDVIEMMESVLGILEKISRKLRGGK